MGWIQRWFQFSVVNLKHFLLMLRSLHALRLWNCWFYSACVDQCEKTGCVGDECSQHCNFTSGGVPVDGPWYLQEPLYLRWKQWDCLSDCRYHCMLAREKERKKAGLKPVKYHGKWPFQRANGIQVLQTIKLAFLLVKHASSRLYCC